MRKHFPDSFTAVLEETAGEKQLLKMMDAKNITTKAGDEVIEGTAVLTQGIPSGAKRHGWLHIKFGNHHIDIQTRLGLPDSEQSVMNVIVDVVKTGKPVENNFTKNFINTKGEPFQIIVGVATKDPDILGNIITAFPKGL